MKEITGDLWELYLRTEYDTIVCTTNGIVKNNGELVMGKGIAKEFNKRFPGLAKEWGNLTTKYGPNVFISPILGCISFPTKYHWADPSSIELIERSATQLSILADTIYGDDEYILMPRPGCGCGNLLWNDVKSVISKILPDNVLIVGK